MVEVVANLPCLLEAVFASMCIASYRVNSVFKFDGQKPRMPVKVFCLSGPVHESMGILKIKCYD